VCDGFRSSSGAPGPGPMRRAGSLLGSWVCCSPVFADGLSVYERLNRLRVTVDPSANAVAIWTWDPVGHILSITRPPTARTTILEIPSPSPQPRPADQRLIVQLSGVAESPRAPARSGARPGRPSRRARLRLGRGSPRVGPRDRSRPRSPSAAGDALVVRTVERLAGQGDRSGSPTGMLRPRPGPRARRAAARAGRAGRMDGSGSQACGRWPASLPVAMGGLVSVYRR
jgi:hypothetical protein